MIFIIMLLSSYHLLTYDNQTFLVLVENNFYFSQIIKLYLKVLKVIITINK